MTGKRTMASKNSFVGKRGYGWVPDVPDQRDYLLSAVLKVPARLPRKVDLRPLCSKVEDQGQLGSCTANALAGAIEFLERKDKVPFQDFSRLFIYYNERVTGTHHKLRFGGHDPGWNQDPGQTRGLLREDLALCGIQV